MPRSFFWLLAAVALFSCSQAQAAFDSASLASGGELVISRIKPSGDDVSAGRQIVLEFNRPVVAVGKMDRGNDEIPIVLTPTLSCHWRWISTRALACELDEAQAMTPSTAYKLEIKPGIKALDGATIAEPVVHTFITRRPTIRDVDFRAWKSPTLPVMRVVWDQPVTKESVLRHMYFKDSDGKRVPVDASEDGEKRRLPRWLRIPGMKAHVRARQQEQSSDDDVRYVDGQEARRVWLVEPESAFAVGKTIEFRVEPGIVSALGPMPGAEDRAALFLDTFPEFSFLGVSCTNNGNSAVRIEPGVSQKPENFCDPLSPISLEFTSPVSRGEVRDVVDISPALGDKKAGTSPWGDLGEEATTVSFAHRADRHYYVYLPLGLKAAQHYKLMLHGEDSGLWRKLRHRAEAALGRETSRGVYLRDRFGRALPSSVAVEFDTGHRSPNVLLEYSAAVLEKDVDSEVPIYVNNLRKINWAYNSLTMDGAKKGLRSVIDVPAVEDVQFMMPVGVRQMLGQKSGALWGSFETTPFAGERYATRKLFAEVTPYQVHFKLGHFNSLVWVTDLATGKPVGDADVQLYEDTFTRLDGPGKAAASARTDANGMAVLPGTAQIDPGLSKTKIWGRDEDQRFFVRVSKGKDMALLPLEYAFLVDSYRSSGTSFYPQNEKKFGHMQAWGTTAQGIYHPGDTIQYKFYVRNQDNKEIIAPPRSGYWLEVVDPMGKVVYKKENVALSEFGSASGDFAVGKTAAVGWYAFHLKANLTNEKGKTGACLKGRANGGGLDPEPDEDNESPALCSSQAEFDWTPLRVLVSDFTPVPFHVRNRLNGDLFRAGDAVEVSTEATLHSGGPYTQAQARVTAVLTPSRFASKNPAAEGFTFGSELASAEPRQIFQTTDELDNKGAQQARFDIDEKEIYYGRLMVESAVQDDRGKNVANQSYADYVGVDRFVGVRLSKWFYTTKDDIAPDFIVVDERGAPVKGASVTLTMEREDRTAARVKSEGSSYVAESEATLVKEAECQETSGALAKACHFKVNNPGDYKLKAVVKDTKGRTQETVLDVWLAGRGYVMWDDDRGAALDIVADKQTYRIGDTAHFLVKNPYPGAKALVTVERYGVIDTFVMTLKDCASVVDIPVKPEYIPGFYLSVNVMSPRVDKPAEPGQVDLGKPAFRMGYVRVPVKDPYKEIVVTAKPDREIYRPGDTVHVKLNAKARFPKNEPVELAVAVLDEAVFDLIANGRAYYDPYDGFYNLEGLDLRNYSLLTRLVGRQKFEKKGANPGGDGGASLNMRSVFKFVSYWNPSLKPDAAGNAVIDFTVPDNLTGWRVLVMASTPSDRFGLGEGSFKVNRPTEVRPEMPNQVSEGDRFDAKFSVMNRTKLDRTIKVEVKAEGDVDSATPSSIEKTLEMKPFERAFVVLPLKASKVDERGDSEQGRIRFSVRAGDASDKDGLEHGLPVYKVRALDVGATYGTTSADRIEEPVAFPDDIYPDVGGVTVTLAPTVIGNLEGAFKYIRDYPYPCWEQVLTRGVMAVHYKNLRAYMPDMLSWPDYEKLPERTLASASDYQAPNGGMTYFVATDSHVDPYLSAYTALAFNWLRHDGYAVPENVESKLHAYLLNFLRHNEAPSFYSEGMSSTVRAVALAALAENRKIDGSDIERYAPAVKQMSLFGKTHFARAAMLTQGSQSRVVETVKLISAEAHETGGKFVFSEELDDGYSRILSSPLRENCAILDLFSSLGETAYGKDLVSDAPFKLVRSITQSRKNKDHFENTQENMFCMNALIDYSRAYEKDKPAMTVKVRMDQKPFGAAEFKDFRDPMVAFERPMEKEDAGKKTSVIVERQGTGRIYYATAMRYAPRQSTTMGTNAGIDVRREYSLSRDGKMDLLTPPFSVRQGDLVRVDLYVSLPAARNFVVVDDPIPGGFEAVNADLANASKVDASKGEFKAAGGSLWFKYNDWNEYNFSFWSFNHQELLKNAARFYADYLPPGNYHLSYMVQAIGAGDFAVMPTLAAEMYDPDVYGKTGFDHLTVVGDQPQSALTQ